IDRGSIDGVLQCAWVCHNNDMLEHIAGDNHIQSQRQERVGENSAPRTDRKVMKNQSGFSLIELIIAMMILTFGMLAMGATMGYMNTQVRVANLQTDRIAAIGQVADQVRAHSTCPTAVPPCAMSF